MSKPGAITARFDVHAHFGLESDGDPRRDGIMQELWENFQGTPPSAWSPEAAIAFMDQRDIALQLLSLPVAADAEIVRAANDQGARLVSAHPDRFGLLAALPMSQHELAVREVKRASDELGADGFVLVTNYGGAYLGDDRFEPVFAELSRRRASVFLHPINPVGSRELCLGRPAPVIEYPMDTARTVLDAVFAGVLLRHSGMRMVLAHAGGALPSLSWRIQALGGKPWTANPRRITRDQMREQMSSLYFDTAIAGEAVSLVPALEVAGASHLVFGTDFPPAGSDVIDATITALASSSALTDDDLDRMDETFKDLFPRAAARSGR